MANTMYRDAMTRGVRVPLAELVGDVGGAQPPSPGSLDVVVGVVGAAIGPDMAALGATHADVERIAHTAVHTVRGMCAATAIFGPLTS